MKTRTGFVSNSSSSSFTCGVCGNTAEGRDLTLEESEMQRCMNSHLFCDEHALGEFPPEGDEESDLYDEEWRYNAKPERCPCCQMKSLSPKDEIEYLRKKAGFVDLKDTEKAFQAEFVTYEEFQKWLKG